MTVMDNNKVAQLLSCFLSPDNAVRGEAEKTFQHERSANIDALVRSLVGLLHTNDDVVLRQQAAVSLRTIFRDFCSGKPASDWERLSKETRETVMDETLNAIEKEQDEAVRKAECFVVAELGSKLLPLSQWPTLVPKLLQFLQSPAIPLKCVGLQILAEIVPYVSDMLRDTGGQMRRVIEDAFSTGDTSCILDALDVLVALVLNEDRHQWKQLQQLLPTVIQILQTYVKQDDTGTVIKIFVKLVDVCEMASGFFKPRIADLLDTCLQICLHESADTQLRQVSMEVVVTTVVDKPQMCVAVDGFTHRIIETLLTMMLSVRDDVDWSMRFEEDRDSHDEICMYDIGEYAIDRVVCAIGGEVMIPILFNYAKMFFEREEWHHKFVAIMAISQTVEYVPEDRVEEIMSAIVNVCLIGAQHPHPRVRFAALQCIGQAALDLQPHFQNTHAPEVMNCLMKCLEDPEARVQAHAGAAFVNFAEECTYGDLDPFLNSVMRLFYTRAKLDWRPEPQPQDTEADLVKKARIIREQSITGLAVIAGVIEERFAQYYPVVAPIMVDIITKATDEDDRTIRGKAIECISIIGLSIKKEVFAEDGVQVLNVLLQLHEQQLEEDDPVKEYLAEGIRRMVRALGDRFTPFLDKMLPHYLALLKTRPAEVDENQIEEDADDMTFLALDNNKYTGMKTSALMEMDQALLLIISCVNVLQEKYQPCIQVTIEALIPLLDFKIAADIMKNALACLADIFQVCQKLTQQLGPANEESCREILRVVRNRVMALVVAEEEEALGANIELMTSQVAGLAKCIGNAGPNMLKEDEIRATYESLFLLMGNSNTRRADIALRVKDPELDEEDREKIQVEYEVEQQYRSSLLECVGSIMKTHPQGFLVAGADLCMKFVETYMTANCPPEDRALALYVCDDVVEYVGDAGCHLWPSFVPNMIVSLDIEDPAVCQAAAYGLIHVARNKHCTAEIAVTACQRFVAIIQHAGSRKKTLASATDNCIAALGAFLIHQPEMLNPHLERYTSVWLQALPLTRDDEEGQNVHTALMEAVKANNPIILGENNANLPQIINIFGEVYRTDFSTDSLNLEIRAFCNSLGKDVIAGYAANLSPKSRRGVDRAFREL